MKRGERVCEFLGFKVQLSSLDAVSLLSARARTFFATPDTRKCVVRSYPAVSIVPRVSFEDAASMYAP
jgi:hypothetical protein